MNYELAQKLKDNGFPIRRWPFGGGVDVLEEVMWYKDYIPTLPELIDACGDDFFRLSHSKNNDGTTWDAEGISAGYIFTGKTHEEAVANLWLKLNGND